MPRDELAIQRRDLLGERHDLPDQDVQRRAGAGWQGVLVRQRLVRQIGDAGIGDETEFRQMRSQRIGEHGALTNEQATGRDAP
jgi:hypothetical protein